MDALEVEEAPELDGLVTDEVWSRAEPATDFVQQRPDGGQGSTEKTEVRVLVSDETLYLGIICFDTDPSGIVVSQARRDGILTDTDSIQILFDTFDDNQNGFVFGTNPFGIEYDGQVTREGRGGGRFAGAGSGTGRSVGQGNTQRGGLSGFNLNWDGVWTVQSRITDRGWETEIAIPFKTLRYHPGEEQNWGLNIMRNIRRKNEQSFWAPVSRADTIQRVSVAGDMTISPPQVRNLQFIPYVLGGIQKDFEINERDDLLDAGLDFKYSVTSDLTLDATVNTDFAQVEVDEEQVNLTRFDLFFPEKHPFFLENAGFFQFGVPQQTDVFFSRQIGIDAVTRAQVPILGGGRLSGKVGRFSMGVLDMQTEEVDGVAPANNFFVARVSREFHTRSTVGFIATNREATSADTFGNSPYNRVWGVDSNIGLGQYTTFFSYFAKTSTPDLTGRDHSGRILVDHVGPLWQFQGGYTEVGEDFNPEIGFVPRKGYRSPIIRAGFSPEPDWSGIRQFTPHLTLRRHYGFDGLLESEWQHYDYGMTFDNGANLGAQFNSFYEYLREPFDVFPGVVDPISVGGYRYNQWLVRGGSDPSAPLFISGAYTKGSFYSGDLRTWSSPDSVDSFGLGNQATSACFSS